MKPTSRSKPEDSAGDALSLKAIFRRFRRNMAIVFGSRVLFGLMNLATNILVVRFFGVAELGIAVLLQGYARLCAGVIKPETWQIVLNYGTKAQHEADEKGDRMQLRRLYGFSFLIDLLTFIATVIVAIAFMPYAISAFEWPENVAKFAPYFILSIFFITPGTYTGILRLYDRIDTLAWQHAINALMRFVGVLLAAVLGGGIYHIVVVWFFASVISGIWPIVVTCLELHRRQCMPVFRFDLWQAGAVFPRFWRFLWMTHLTRQTSQILTHGTALFIGAQIGAAAAGAYEIARRFASAISKPSRMLGPLIFPEVAKLAARKDWKSIHKLIQKQLRVTALIVAALALFLMLVLPWLIELLYGPELITHTWLFRVHILGALVSILGFAVEPFLLSANKPGTVLGTAITCLGLYIIICSVLYAHIGVLAFAIGLLSYFILYLIISVGVSMRLLAKRRQRTLLQYNQPKN